MKKMIHMWKNLKEKLEDTLNKILTEDQLKRLYFIYIAYEIAASDGLAKEESKTIKEIMSELVSTDEFILMCNVFYDHIHPFDDEDIIAFSDHLLNSCTESEKADITKDTTAIVGGDGIISKKEIDMLEHHLPKNMVKKAIDLWKKESKRRKK